MHGGQNRGAALRDARRNKERNYPELLQDLQCRLIVLGFQMGERWGGENATFVELWLTPKPARPKAFCAKPSPPP